MTSLRVLTINVQNNEGEPGRMKILNQGLRQLAPDLVAFQEVMQESDRSQLGELRRRAEASRTANAPR